jgi:Rps23 Pro-64 3,4-dihydroxylase Tpa1-like proline 4-hydroxylase
MGPHTDSYKDQDNSLITVILYLNDNYEGGDLFFPEQNLIIKPQSGSIIVFPSTFPFVHESKKIINGHKYIASMF